MPFSPFVIMLAAIAAIALLIAISRFAKNYIKVPPNAVAIFSGRKHKLPDGRFVGYRMVRGGAAFRFPLLEQVDYLSLNVFTIPLEIKRAYTGRVLMSWSGSSKGTAHAAEEDGQPCRRSAQRTRARLAIFPPVMKVALPGLADLLGPGAWPFELVVDAEQRPPGMSMARDGTHHVAGVAAHDVGVAEYGAGLRDRSRCGVRMWSLPSA